MYVDYLSGLQEMAQACVLLECAPVGVASTGVVYGAWADGDTPKLRCWDEDGHRVILGEFPLIGSRRKDQRDGRWAQH